MQPNWFHDSIIIDHPHSSSIVLKLMTSDSKLNSTTTIYPHCTPPHLLTLQQATKLSYPHFALHNITTIHLPDPLRTDCTQFHCFTRKPQPASHNRIKIWVLPPSAKLKKASICPVPHSNEKGLCIRTKWHTRYLTKEIDFLLLLVPTINIKHMDKICRLCHSHESAIRCIVDWTNRSKVSLQGRHRRRKIPNIPDSAGFILVSSSKG